jgi:hypothetical protein
MHRFVPGSSLVRTWSVTPSGSQPESFAVEQRSESRALSTPHQTASATVEGFPRTAPGQPHQLRETRERQCHGLQSSRCRAVFHARVISAQRGPPPAMLTAHDQAPQLVWVAPTSTHHRPRPRFDTCSRVPASSGPMPLCARFSFSNRLVTRSSRCQARYGLGPRGVPMPLARARHGLLPAGGTNPSALSDSIFERWRVGKTDRRCVTQGAERMATVLIC